MSEVDLEESVSADGGAIDREFVMKPNFKWGVFVFMSKAATQRAQGGGWQAVCPFHAKSMVTACAKYMALRSADADAEAVVLAALNNWATTANRYTLAWQHSDEPTVPELLPPLGDLGRVLDARLEADCSALTRDVVVVRSDVELACTRRR